jgi:hypothetical protein
MDGGLMERALAGVLRLALVTTSVAARNVLPRRVKRRSTHRLPEGEERRGERTGTEVTARADTNVIDVADDRQRQQSRRGRRAQQTSAGMPLLLSSPLVVLDVLSWRPVWCPRNWRRRSGSPTSRQAHRSVTLPMSISIPETL